MEVEWLFALYSLTSFCVGMVFQEMKWISSSTWLHKFVQKVTSSCSILFCGRNFAITFIADTGTTFEPVVGLGEWGSHIFTIHHLGTLSYLSGVCRSAPLLICEHCPAAPVYVDVVLSSNPFSQGMEEQRGEIRAAYLSLREHHHPALPERLRDFQVKPWGFEKKASSLIPSKNFS